SPASQSIVPGAPASPCTPAEPAPPAPTLTLIVSSTSEAPSAKIPYTDSPGCALALPITESSRNPALPVKLAPTPTFVVDGIVILTALTSVVSHAGIHVVLAVSQPPSSVMPAASCTDSTYVPRAMYTIERPSSFAWFTPCWIVKHGSV